MYSLIVLTYDYIAMRCFYKSIYTIKPLLRGHVDDVSVVLVPLVGVDNLPGVVVVWCLYIVAQRPAVRMLHARTHRDTRRLGWKPDLMSLIDTYINRLKALSEALQHAEEIPDLRNQANNSILLAM